MANIVARLRYARISPRKARLVADSIRGLSVARASEQLRFSDLKAAGVLGKVLDSAVANAEQNHGADVDLLRIAAVRVDQGPVMKRMLPRARGRADQIRKPTSHIIVEVVEEH